jgi:hypothetical protein
MIKRHIKFLILLLPLLAVTYCMAQQKNANWREEAVWIKMIDDPNVNYYEAIKAYNEYWKTHKKPVEQEDDKAELDKSGEKPTARPVPTREEKIYEDEMTYQIKRFETWVREEKPFVQENGRILTQQERIEIWKKQQEQQAK